MFYGGIQGCYSGTLTCVKSSLNPTMQSNHDAGRCIKLNVQMGLSTISIVNNHAYKKHIDHTLLWRDLAQRPSGHGFFCGNFIMVVHPSDSITRASSMTWAEKQSWDLILDMHDLHNACTDTPIV